MSSEPESTDSSARGRRWPLAALTLLCPSIGYMSVGRLGAGLVANALVVSVQLVLLVVTAYLQAFPGTTLLFAVLAWLILTGMMATEVVLEAREQPGSFDEGYHWTSRIAVGILTYVLPLAVLVGVAGANLYTVVSVKSDGMYPTLREGDRVFVARSFAAPEPIQRGQLATIRTSSHGLRIVRNVALPGQSFSMAGHHISVNQQQIPASPIDAAEVQTRLDGLDGRDAFSFWLEGSGSNRYVVSYAATGAADLLIPPVKLGDDEWFGLADNRSQHRLGDGSAPIVDSRQLGPLGTDQVVGRPAFVAWSVDPTTGDIDWERTWARMGLRLQ